MSVSDATRHCSCAHCLFVSVEAIKARQRGVDKDAIDAFCSSCCSLVQETRHGANRRAPPIHTGLVLELSARWVHPVWPRVQDLDT